MTQSFLKSNGATRRRISGVLSQPTTAMFNVVSVVPDLHRALGTRDIRRG